MIRKGDTVIIKANAIGTASEYIGELVVITAVNELDGVFCFSDTKRDPSYHAPLLPEECELVEAP